MILLNVWTTSGTFMLFYLASLQSISHEVYEAAAIDGAGPGRRSGSITFPLLRPGHFFVATVAVIGALQLFDQAFIGGGVERRPQLRADDRRCSTSTTRPSSSSTSAIAAAVGVILFVVIFTATLVQRRLFGQAPAW